MASDGENLFVIFLYSNISWIKTTPTSFAQVGFDAGDGINFYTLPGSYTEAVMNVTQISNVGVPGMLVFKVSGPSVKVGGCLDEVVGKLMAVLGAGWWAS